MIIYRMRFSKNLSGPSLGKCALKGPGGKRWIVGLEERENGLFFYAAGWQDFVKDHLLQVGEFLVACEKDVEEAEGRRNQARVKEEIVESETENYDADCENKGTIENPCFMETLKRYQEYCVKISLKVPPLVRGVTGTVMLRNESGRSCCAKVILRPKSSFHRVELTTVGDTVIFEFVKQSVIQIHVFRAVRGKRCAVVLGAPNVKNES
ncbi:B3 domain-containing protein [Pyrus ussuriensis x Pyrus communis]|uniref:B3 domain-containing protein n=1 Tax=Pyrus ussuriensis x Pyrus communis TaxID=2448454 RepID=A0A5N5FR69_9ROSA|nr:B3 domain-containing protein [Pyrus ussuriensis x Pyrus communis]